MSYGKKLYKSNLTAFDAENVYDSTIGKLQNEINADQIVSLNGKVSKAGDIITGDLTISHNDGAIYLQDPLYGYGDLPSSTQSQWILFKEKSGVTIGTVRSNFLADGSANVHIRARASVNNANVDNGLVIQVNADGTRSIGVTAPAAWREAIGAVSKSGDTMTGTLKNKTPLIDVTASAPSSALYPAHHLIVDKNDKTIGGIYGTYNTIGNLGMAVGSQRTVNGSIVYNWLSLLVDPNGKQAVSVSNADAWRSALALGEIINSTNNGATIAVPNDTAVVCSSITLTQGVWVLVVNVDWDTNASGYRQVAVGSSALNPGRDGAVTSYGLAGKQVYLNHVSIKNVTSASQIFNIYARQNSGSSLSCYPYAYAVRVG